MTELKKYLEEKLKECRELSDFWHNKYLMTGNPKHKEEYKQYQGKEEAYYDVLEQLLMKGKNE